MGNKHEHDNWLYAILAFLYSFFKSFFAHIDGWAVLQSVLCAVLGYLAVRAVRSFFPENTNKS